jgi:hypothetical protein
MNYYDELGLAPDAPDEDIRRVHRTLSKLLHPDLQTDPAAREAAELQMRRINVIVGTLLDPMRRREYDASLRAGPLPVVVLGPDQRDAPWRRHFGGPVGMLLLVVTAALAVTGAAIWLLDGDLVHFQTADSHPATPPENGAPATPRQPASPAPAAVRSVAPVARENTPLVEPPRATATSGKPQRAAVSAPVVLPSQPAAQPPPKGMATRMAPALVQDTPSAPPPQPIRAPSAVAPSVAAAPAPTTPVLTPQEPAPTAPPPGAALAGLWLYAPDTQKTGAKVALYAAEYIQLQIRAEDGMVHGEYSARYQVPDRPISGQVAFHFQGKADGSRSYTWQSDDGSLGMVDLKMLTAESMQVNWRVGHFGSRLGLGAGTAVLIRKIDR